MVNKKNKYLAAQIATQGPTKGQQRIARRVQQYDELMRRQQPLTKKDAAGVRKSPPTKHERKITRACQHQAKLVRKEVRQANRGNIAALLDATKSSRPEVAPALLTPEAEMDYLFQFCGNVITAQSEDEATQAAIEASAAPFDPYRRVLFASGTAKGSKLKATAAVVCKKAAPGYNNNDSADGIWEEKVFGLDLPPSNSTQKSIEAGLRSIAEALALVATRLACARDEGISHNDKGLYKRPKVTIFTDSQAVMDKVSRINFTARQLKSTPCIEKLITRSEYLRHLGVKIELRCSPCLQSEGTKRAKDASRRAAKSEGACKSVDGVDEGLQILID